jgi:probable blue pigment (indigoidine) exporter
MSAGAAERPYRNAAIAAVAPTIWGSTYVVTTELLPPDRPLLAALLRALPAGLILLAIRRVLPRGQWWWRALVLGTLNVGAFFYLLFQAAYHLPGGVAALVLSTSPTIVMLLSVLLLNARIRLAHAGAAAVGLGGVALLVLKANAALDAVGVAAALAGAASFSLGIVLTKKWGRPEGVGLLDFTGWQLTAGGVVLLPVTLAGEGLPSSLNGDNVAGYAYLGIIGALFAYALWFRGIDRLPAVTVSFLSFISPVVATLLGWIVLGETLSGLQVVGALAVVGAVLLAQFAPGRARPAAEVVVDEPVAEHAPAEPATV